MNRRTWVAVSAVFGTLLLVPSANAATLSVDDDGDDCPAASHSSIQSAIDAANPGDTVAVCPGTYTEGSGAPSTNALTITKDLTLKGAGADEVFIQPKRSTPTGGQIAAGSPIIRDNVGNMVAIIGGSNFPITVNVSGVTVRGNGVYSEVGVLFLDAQGSLLRTRVTDVVTSEASSAFSQAGGFRSNNVGIGVAHVTAAPSTPPSNPPRTLTITQTRIDRYNKTGLLEDAATGDAPPLTASGVDNRAVVANSHIIGRIKCQNFPADGNCQNPQPPTTGPLFGQDGIRVTGGARLTMSGSLVSQNLVNGTGAPTRSTFNTGCTTLTSNSANNANLPLAAGVRLLGAGPSTINTSNILDNSYAVNNLDADGTTPNVTTPVSAENNWWGMHLCRGFNATFPLIGPAISPTSNPPFEENPVNGTPVADPTCVLAPGNNSTTVDFCPFRGGSRGDPNAGEFNVSDAPIPVNDAPPTVEVSSDDTEYDRGDTVQLSADGADDFGVKQVRFFDGANPIGTVTAPPYEVGFTIPQNAPCATRTFTAVATDSSGQTASDSIEVEVVGPNDCVSEPDAPDITFDNPPSTIGQDGVTVTALPVAPAGVEDVEFFLGNRSVCTDTTDPYTCEILPNGDEVGVQTLRAVVTDDLDRTAEVATAVTVEKFDPAFLGLAIEKQKLDGKRYEVTIKGRIHLPPRVAVEDACADGTMTLTVERNGLTLFPSSQVGLQDDCTYELKFRTKEKKGKTYHYDVDASFGGNSVLNPISDSGGFSR